MMLNLFILLVPFTSIAHPQHTTGKKIVLTTVQQKNVGSVRGRGAQPFEEVELAPDLFAAF